MPVRHSERTDMNFNMELNPLVGRMASRLLQSFASDQDQRRWELITEVLGFAAEAEQRLGEQRERIHQLEALAMTDELTGVGNRRGFDDFMKRALANARRHGETGVVAFLDLDDFKTANDRFGHEVGDEILHTVARLLSANIRVSDYVARVGGDEFMVVLTHCNADNGRRRALDLQRLLDNATISHEGSLIRLRSSIGTAAYARDTVLARLLREADENMYKDKMQRRRITPARSMAS